MLSTVGVDDLAKYKTSMCMGKNRQIFN